MNTSPNQRAVARGFTLIELLVVIAVIAILAALLLPVGAKIMQKAAINRARTELQSVEMAINSYKAKKGFFPPDNTNNVARNVLYYELVGCRRLSPSGFVTLDGSVFLSALQLTANFGTSITGIMNSSANVNSDDAVAAEPFLKEIKPSQYADANGVRWLGVMVLGPTPAMVGELNPFRYNSSNPTNNVNSFDLWVDVVVGAKTNRISNWRATPEIVY